jgi:hypothetical protein
MMSRGANILEMGVLLLELDIAKPSQARVAEGVVASRQKNRLIEDRSADEAAELLELIVSQRFSFIHCY